MESGKRYQVFSVRETRDKEGRAQSVWVKAGSAWVNRDGSLNVYLDVLPLDGKLHVREPVADKRDGEARVSANGSPAKPGREAHMMEGH
jgi:hypothetical protein